MQPFRVCFDFRDVIRRRRSECQNGNAQEFQILLQRKKEYVRTILMVVGRAELCEDNISRISEISRTVIVHRIRTCLFPHAFPSYGFLAASTLAASTMVEATRRISPMS